MWERARAALGGLAHVVSAEMHIEFLTPGVHKGAALAWLCEHEGLSCAQAVAFGDNQLAPKPTVRPPRSTCCRLVFQ